MGIWCRYVLSLIWGVFEFWVWVDSGSLTGLKLSVVIKKAIDGIRSGMKTRCGWAILCFGGGWWNMDGKSIWFACGGFDLVF